MHFSHELRVEHQDAELQQPTLARLTHVIRRKRANPTDRGVQIDTTLSLCSPSSTNRCSRSLSTAPLRRHRGRWIRCGWRRKPFQRVVDHSRSLPRPKRMTEPDASGSAVVGRRWYRADWLSLVIGRRLPWSIMKPTLDRAAGAWPGRGRRTDAQRTGSRVGLSGDGIGAGRTAADTEGGKPAMHASDRPF